VRNSYVSITPLNIELTAGGKMEKMLEWNIAVKGDQD
jgi:hypothetical protein